MLLAKWQRKIERYEGLLKRLARDKGVASSADTLKYTRLLLKQTKRNFSDLADSYAYCIGRTPRGGTPTPVPSPTPEGPAALTAESASFQSLENNALAISLVTSGAVGQVEFLINAAPQHGTLSGAGSELEYTPDFHFLGSDQFSFTARDEAQREATGIIQIEVVPASQEFAGDAQSLEPYRGSLTEYEMRVVLNKIAFGGNQRFVDSGLSGGRAAFVESLINDDPDHQENNLPLEIPRSGDFYDLGDGEYYIYDYMLRGNPLREFIAYQLRDIFSVNLPCNNSASHNKCIPWYVNLYQQNALNFAAQHSEEPDPAKPCYNVGLPGSYEHLLCMQNWDLAMLRFLGNDSNSRFSSNENFGREFLELFSLKTHDVFTLQPNYTEADMLNSTYASTGYGLDYSTGHAVPVFDDYFFDNRNKLLFAGQPWEMRGRFNYQDMVQHILYQVPAARSIAIELFSRFVHPFPSEELADTLAERLKNDGYHIGRFVRMLLNSSAMYSALAHKPCVSEPLISAFRLLRQTQIPINNADVRWRLHELLLHTDDIPLQPSDIFGKQLCGVIRAGKILQGERAATVSNMHYHIRDLNRLFLRIKQTEPPSPQYPDSAHWDFRASLPSPTISREAFLAHLERVFALSLNASERNLILNYMYDGESGNISENKVIGTYLLIYGLPQFHQR